MSQQFNKIISIFGGQSSGKSTLLNDLFKTKFQTLDSNGIRQRTTQGIIADIVDNSLIMDTEGSDSTQRNLDNKSLIYDNKLCLLTSVASDIMLFNIFYQEIGRFKASGYDILYQTFRNIEKYKQLDQNQQKTKVIIVVRDNQAQSDEQREQIKEQIFQDIKDLYKNANQNIDSFDKLLDLNVVFLQHKKYENQQYLDGVDNLRKMILDYKIEQPYETYKYKFLKNVHQAIQSDIQLDIKNIKLQSIEQLFKEEQDKMLSSLESRLIFFRNEVESTFQIQSQASSPQLSRSGCISFTELQQYNQYKSTLQNILQFIFNAEIQTFSDEISDEYQKIYDKFNINLNNEVFIEFQKKIKNLINKNNIIELLSQKLKEETCNEYQRINQSIIDIYDIILTKNNSMISISEEKSQIIQKMQELEKLQNQLQKILINKKLSKYLYNNKYLFYNYKNFDVSSLIVSSTQILYNINLFGQIILNSYKWMTNILITEYQDENEQNDDDIINQIKQSYDDEEFVTYINLVTEQTQQQINKQQIEFYKTSLEYMEKETIQLQINEVKQQLPQIITQYKNYQNQILEKYNKQIKTKQFDIDTQLYIHYYSTHTYKDLFETNNQQDEMYLQKIVNMEQIFKELTCQSINNVIKQIQSNITFDTVKQQIQNQIDIKLKQLQKQVSRSQFDDLITQYFEEQSNIIKQLQNYEVESQNLQDSNFIFNIQITNDQINQLQTIIKNQLITNNQYLIKNTQNNLLLIIFLIIACRRDIIKILTNKYLFILAAMIIGLLYIVNSKQQMDKLLEQIQDLIVDLVDYKAYINYKQHFRTLYQDIKNIGSILLNALK